MRIKTLAAGELIFLLRIKIMVELKAITILEKVHLAQALNYLEAYNMEIGLLINFGETSLKFHRLTNERKLQARQNQPNKN